jgi:hypothetical protein
MVALVESREGLPPSPFIGISLFYRESELGREQLADRRTALRRNDACSTDKLPIEADGDVLLHG